MRKHYLSSLDLVIDLPTYKKLPGLNLILTVEYVTLEELKGVFLKYQTVWSDVRPHFDKDDGRLWDNLWEMIIPRQKLNTAAMASVLLGFYQVV